ncbi:MAG: hypothetical protein IPI75_05255 [Gammaproteobacteria bacterium]|nr:hypothetical protein [Gammaproteobacteria bacterium]MBK8305548.1 hypothetical protein [Gammaproteobacteria bacterium]
MLEKEHKLVSLLLYANGPAVESAFGSPVLASVGDVQLTGNERWYIKSFEHDAFFVSVTTLNQAFHRYVNQTLED